MTLGRVAFLLSDLSGGGVQRMTLALMRGLTERAVDCELVLCRAQGPLLDAIPAGIAVTSLKASGEIAARAAIWRADPLGTAALARPILLPSKTWKIFRRLPALVDFLQQSRPRALIAATPPLNLMAVWARRLAGVPLRVVLTERTAPSFSLTNEPVWHKRYLSPVMRRTYRRAEAIVAVSQALADDLASFTRLPRNAIRTIYNPVVGPEVARGALAPLDDPWFAEGSPPVVLGVGRLSKQKDFPTLIRAFARLRGTRAARLMILGGGSRPEEEKRARAELQALASELGVAEDVRLQGFIDNPFAYLARAGLFALSSRYEGLGNALIEALACGCPVVSTDCPAGPSEILGGGRWGRLVPVGDDAALAGAMAATLDHLPDRAALRARASAFSLDAAVDRYIDLLTGNQEASHGCGFEPCLPARPA
jgi:glycosyltransferase involved in cell wall biosynthesis